MTQTISAEDLESAVETALWNYSPIRGSLSDLQVTVSPDGRVEVSGPVRAGLIKDGVLEALRWVPGVTGIVDGLVADNELEIRVAIALAQDPRLSSLSPGAVSVHSHLGRVTLVASLKDEALSAAAQEVASQVAGVQSVDDLTTAEPSET